MSSRKAVSLRKRQRSLTINISNRARTSGLGGARSKELEEQGIGYYTEIEAAQSGSRLFLKF